MAAVRAGGDRQDLHERIRRHSLAAAEQVKMHGRSNDLIERLRDDAQFKSIDLGSLLDPRKFVGRAPEQVATFIDRVVNPIRARYAKALNQGVELKV